MLLLPLRILARRQLRRERQFRVRTDPFDVLDDEVFYNRFRFTKAAVLDLARCLHDSLSRSNRRWYTLTVPEQLLICLRFYATGTFYNEIGDRSRIHKSTVCRTVKRVTMAIVS
jgi:nuclease HARBI1